MVFSDTCERVVRPAKGVTTAAWYVPGSVISAGKTAEPKQVKVLILQDLISSKLKSIKSMGTGSKSYAGETKQGRGQLNFKEDKENVESLRN